MFLEIQGLSIETESGKPVLRDVSFSVDREAVIGIIGPNGAGKTTHVDALSGFVKPDLRLGTTSHFTVGGVSVLESEPKDIPAIIKPTFEEWMSAFSLIRLGLRLRGLPRSVTRTVTLEFAERFSFERSLLKRKRRRLSSGQIRRAELLSMLAPLYYTFEVNGAGNPSVLLFDEPMNGVDTERFALADDIATWATARGCVVVYIAHDREEIEALCAERTDAKLLVLEGGRVTAFGPYREIRDKSDSAFVRTFFRENDLSKGGGHEEKA